MPVPFNGRAAPAALACVLAAVLAAFFAIPLAGSAHAQEAFRFWGYYTWQDNTWAFAQTGPDQTKPADGSVEGWRFAVSGAEASARGPRTAGDFATICGTAPTPPAGQKRVAVLIDYGVAAEAPQGETPPDPRGACATVPVAASGAEVLQEVAPVRVQNALVCGVDGYPRTECGVPYDGPLPDPTASEAPVQFQIAGQETVPPTAAGSEPDDGFPVGIVIAGILVIAVGGAALVVSRRRSSGT
jgi:hypothetical protein